MTSGSIGAIAGYAGQSRDYANAAQGTATPRTQYESLCESISERMGLLSSEISALHATCQPVLPGEPNTADVKGASPKPVGHSSPMMNFLEHIGEQLSSMEERVRHVRVRMPF